jgi:dimethylhistidine N-methyltransferase
MDSAAPRYQFFDLLEARGDPAAEICAGIAADPAFISPKFFYDELGARLFEAICALPEYTLPTDEQTIFDRRIAEIAATVRTGATLVDLGAGNCAKAERLFSSMRPAQYVAVDIAADFLRAQLERVAERNPQIEIVGVAVDFMHQLRLPDAVLHERRVAFYPGSSIGNFDLDAAVAFLTHVRALCPGHLILGADLEKDDAGLVSAYDDALGVTAAFNRNVLHVANRIAETDFAIEDWSHVALYNRSASRIEMHLEARRALTVRWPGGARSFAAGERIHTENSYKYTLPRLTALLRAAGYSTVRIYTDARDRFAVALAQ